MRRAMLFAGAAVALGLTVGCQTGSVKYVQKFDDGGVVAIKVDTPEAREKAKQMMADHVGAGFRVVNEEVVSADGRPAGGPGLNPSNPSRPGTPTAAKPGDETEIRLHYRKMTAGMTAPAAGGVVPASASVPSVLPPGGTVIQASHGTTSTSRTGTGVVPAGGVGAGATTSPPACMSGGAGPCFGALGR